MSFKNGMRLTAVISIGMSLLVTGSSYIWYAAGANKQIMDNSDKIKIINVEAKGLPLRLNAIERNGAINQTKILNNKMNITELFTDQNMMRQEIQLNAELKLNREDFFREQEDTNDRLLYLERHN